jgi:hypothetical protein
MIEHGILLVLCFKAAFQGIVLSAFSTASSDPVLNWPHYGPEILQVSETSKWTAGPSQS